MTIEELMKLTAAELKEKADSLGVEYSARATKTELAELIYAKTNDQETAETVAQAFEGSDNDLLSEEDFAIVTGQMVKIITKKDGETIEAETSLDDLLDSFKPMIDENITLLDENDTLTKENDDLKSKNAELEKIAYREVIGHPSQEPEESVIFWNGQDQMTIRARVMPNKGISNRIRGGHEFTLQYQIITVDKALFDVLSKDQYIQIDTVGSDDE